MKFNPGPDNYYLKNKNLKFLRKLSTQNIFDLASPAAAPGY